MGEPDTAEPDEARRIATEARDRVRFEEEALALADQVYRVARRFVSSREEAEDLVQDTYARAFRSWQSYTPGTNLRAWLLRILTNLNVDRGRRIQRRPDDFRDVVVLVDIGDFSYADAAQILDVPLGTVMSRLHRGRRLLKAKLAEEAVS